MNKAQRKYIKDYFNKRYNSDDKFKERIKKLSLNSYHKITKFRRANKLCTRCGILLEEDYILCKNCRRKRREIYYSKK